MLVLTRKYNEAVLLTVPPSDKPTTIIVNMAGTNKWGHTKLGFIAPDEVLILRGELHQLTQQQSPREA